MKNCNLGEMEQRFADIIWSNAPVQSGQLVKICDVELGWKKSTTYTMLKRLCDRNIFINDNGIVSVIISKDDFLAMQSDFFVNETFDGSLPKFLSAFTRRKKLSNEEIKELQKLIDDYSEE